MPIARTILLAFAFILFSNSVFAELPFKINSIEVREIAPKTFIETTDVEFTTSDNTAPERARRANLTMIATPLIPERTITMMAQCSTENLDPHRVEFGFAGKDANTESKKHNFFESDKKGVLSVKIGGSFMLEENWIYVRSYGKSGEYRGKLVPADVFDFVEFRKKSTVFLKQIENAKSLTNNAESMEVKIKLENGLEIEGSFDLDRLTNGLEQMKAACHNMAAIDEEERK